MALTRKFLTALGIESEKIDEIIAAHAETVDALKADRDKYKEEADKIPDLQKELETAKGDSSYKEKYEKEHADFEKFKGEQTEKETNAKKQEAYRKLLKDAGISEKHINSVLKASDYKSLTFDDKGNVVDSKKIVDAIKADWPDMVTTTETHGAESHNPPDNNGGTLSADAQYARARFAQRYADRYGADAASQQGNGGNGGNGTTANNGGNE